MANLSGKKNQGLLRIELQKQNGHVKLTVADNGPGLPEDFDSDTGGLLGSMLIDTFAAQLEAEKEISSSEAGTAFMFIFSVN